MTDSPTSILIIDNDEALSEALAIRLEASGYACISAVSGMQGLSLFSERDFDAVITDLNMPNGSGIDVCESIRGMSNVPILVITGFESDFSSKLDQLSNVSVIRKPFEFDEIQDEIEILLELGTVQFE